MGGDAVFDFVGDLFEALDRHLIKNKRVTIVDRQNGESTTCDERHRDARRESETCRASTPVLILLLVLEVVRHLCGSGAQRGTRGSDPRLLPGQCRDDVGVQIRCLTRGVTDVNHARFTLGRLADPGERIVAEGDDLVAQVLKELGLVRRGHRESVHFSHESHGVLTLDLSRDVDERRDDADRDPVNLGGTRIDLQPSSRLRDNVKAENRPGRRLAFTKRDHLRSVLRRVVRAVFVDNAPVSVEERSTDKTFRRSTKEFGRGGIALEHDAVLVVQYDTNIGGVEEVDGGQKGL